MSSSSDAKINVLFVCLGNICRSTMAEGVFRNMVRTHPAGKYIGEIDSAGTGAYHTDSPPDSRTMDVLEQNGITEYNHGARQTRKRDMSEFDYIFGMDKDNLKSLQRLERTVQRAAEQAGDSPAVKAKVMLFGEYSGRTRKNGQNRVEEVDDPYYGGDEGFDAAYEQVSRFSKNFLDEVLKTRSEAR